MLDVSDNIWEKVINFFYQNEAVLNEDVTKLREWMKTQPHLPEIMDEKSVKNFLILSKGSVEKVKKKIDCYYTVRTRMRDIYEEINPKFDYMKEIMAIAYLIPLPKLTKEMYRVFLCKLRDSSKIDRLEPDNIIRYSTNIQELRLKEDVLYGDVIVIDASDFTFNFLLKCASLATFKKAAVIYENVYSCRLKGLYFINAPSFLDKVVKVLKIVMSPKLFERIHVFQDPNTLYEYLSREILPRDYSGEEKSLEELQEILKLKFEENQNLFDRLDTLKVNENLRPENLENDEILGYHGNFKQLIDLFIILNIF